ncbi:hypothetical protein Pyn_22804 [Prunus yedoensis var. nudiflora]|uniref:VQ domain-containing protein n=1 Tax=Prunus yedoensis var. nudiflora TaxID=2094558 RepID=A0A314XMF3_PRUYE|nr:hypothetical protein Pyn_22804 [Prunus yedoensis var. nudiflora]
MEQLRNHHSHHQPQPDQSKKPTKAKAPMIKYISSPMMVQASNASEFRAIVQQLTGQDSNIAVFDDQQGTHDEQASWVSSSNHEASKADRMMRFSEGPPLPVAVLDQPSDENNVWEAVAESLSAFQSPCVYV